ncbi:MAG: hypothetical protein GY807_18935 [Gammaproteobacteria bacterium]|nr:hypothetical protein [Gammaproteobacteria bacterium]
MSDEGTKDKVELTDAHKKDIREKKNAQAALKAATAENDEFRARLEAIESEKADAQAKADAERLESKGKYDEALAKQQETAAGKIAEANTRGDKLTSALQNALGRNALVDELGSAGVKAEYLNEAASLLNGRYNVALDDDGNPSVTVLKDGAQMMGEDGTPATLADLAKAFAASHAHYLPPSGDNGTGLSKNGSPGTVTIEELDADKTGRKMAEYIEKHGRDAYLKLSLSKKKKAE